jgi:hypothetical protein
MKTSVAVLVVFALAGPAVAQVKYVDEAGNSHYVQNENMVPEQYRAKVRPVTSLPSVRIDGPQGGAPYSGPMYGVGQFGSGRLESQDRRQQNDYRQAGEQNLAQKRADEAKRAACNRSTGSARLSVDCLVR